MPFPFRIPLTIALVVGAQAAWAQDTSEVAGPQGSWYSGEYNLTIGAAVFTAPSYEGDDDYEFYAQPLVSFGKAGRAQPFDSRNDNISLAIFEAEAFRAGVTGKLLFERDKDDSDDLEGLDPVRFGGEAGVFAEVYATDWLRVRGEVRHGIRTHDAIVGDVAADAFVDLAPAIRISGGPRISFAGSDYFDTYYGVDAEASADTGLARYEPEGGVKSVGVGGAVTWKTTDAITTTLFGEYSRLVGPAADSSLVKRLGSEDQLILGVSATYRFGFRL